MLRFLTEGIGTFLLVLAIGLSTDPIAAGFMLMILIYIGYSFTDVHLNPAVSIGAWTFGADSTLLLLTRISGQFIGALGGAYLTLWIALIPYVPEPAMSVGVTMFILLEFLFSGLFVLLFLLMVYPASRRIRTLFGGIIGIGFSACLMILEPLIGFGMHPALNAAFSIVDYTEGGKSYMHLPIYLFTPLVAGILAALLHKNVMSRLPTKEHQQRM